MSARSRRRKRGTPQTLGSPATRFVSVSRLSSHTRHVHYDTAEGSGLKVVAAGGITMCTDMAEAASLQFDVLSPVSRSRRFPPARWRRGRPYYGKIALAVRRGAHAHFSRSATVASGAVTRSKPGASITRPCGRTARWPGVTPDQFAALSARRNHATVSHNFG